MRAGFPPIPVESASAKPPATVGPSSTPASSGPAMPPLKISPKPQIQRQSMRLCFIPVAVALSTVESLSTLLTGLLHSCKMTW